MLTLEFIMWYTLITEDYVRDLTFRKILDLQAVDVVTNSNKLLAF